MYVCVRVYVCTFTDRTFNVTLAPYKFKITSSSSISNLSKKDQLLATHSSPSTCNQDLTHRHPWNVSLPPYKFKEACSFLATPL